jgi:hypothetical protein
VRRSRDRQIALQAALQAEAQRVTAALERSHEAEVAQRQVAIQAAAAALARYGQAQQPINRGLNCTTMEIRPGFSTTNCY